MHESLSRFSEGFAGFLYGLNMNAYCVEWPEAPGEVSFKREESGALAQSEEGGGGVIGGNRWRDLDSEMTFM